MVQRRFIYKGNYHQSGGSLAGVLALLSRFLPRFLRGAKAIASNPTVQRTVKSAGKQLVKTGISALDAAQKGQKITPAVQKSLNKAKVQIAKAA